MQWTSTLSLESDLDAAVEEVAAAVRGSLDGVRPDLAVVFVSNHHAHAYERLPLLLRRALDGGLVFGCSAGGVIGGGSEVERKAGLSLTAAVLPDVQLSPFYLRAGDLPAAGAGPAEWEALARVDRDRRPHFVLLPDPLTFDAEPLLAGIDGAFPGGAKIGGLASGGSQADANVLYMGANAYRSGAVGLALHGDVEVDTVVAQGCRPIGSPMFVTSGEGNRIVALDGAAPLDVLRELYGSLGSEDRDIFRHSLFIGLVMRSGLSEYRHGDYLVRNVIGIDETDGALAIAADVTENMVVQFHLRDAKTSADDLDQLLTRLNAERPAAGEGASGSLMFSCLGRGAGLYGRPDHDSEAFKRHLGAVPLGGFFCNGEIGEVQGRTFLHGYTSSFGLFRPRDLGR